MHDTSERQKLILLLAVGLFYSLALAWFLQGLPQAKLTSDLFPRWYAGRMMLTTGRSVYDWANAPEISAITGWPKLHQLGYFYPAYMLIFTAPLSLLPYPVAHVLWVVAGLWMLWLAMFIVARTAVPQLSLNRLTLLLALVSTAVPVFQHTLYAQFNTIGLLALALSYRALVRRRYFAAGVWAGGLAFKPQATLLTLFVFLAWTALRRTRWMFWVGLAVAGGGLWAIGEILEPNWLPRMVGSLGRYEPVQSVVEIITGDPFRLVSLLLFSLTLGLAVRLRRAGAGDVRFSSLLVLSLCVNALIVPMFGMLHMVLLGPVVVILLGNFDITLPHLAHWMWVATIALFTAGWLAFILPLLLTDTPGLQILAAEIVYRFSMPLIFGAVALALILSNKPMANDQ